jgi:hypothetical protein
MKRFETLFLAALVLGPATALAAETIENDALPADVRPFVVAGTRAIFLADADLNGDGTKDAILVIEKQKAKPTDEDIEDRQRPLLILIRDAAGKLTEAARNEKVVYCATCGGMMGDPFQEVEVGKKTFTVLHYGGSAWRWSVSYKFNYSRRDNTWQLVSVEQSNFHAMEPDKEETTVSVPPKDYGKIGIAEFDPDNWKGKGSK